MGGLQVPGDRLIASHAFRNAVWIKSASCGKQLSWAIKNFNVLS
jgi:hypothetical protein